MAGYLTIDGREKKRKKKESAKDRFERDTMEENEAIVRGRFQKERKIAHEILDKIDLIGLPLKLDRLTKCYPFSFITAILQQLRIPKIYKEIDPVLKKLADQMSQILFRKELSKFFFRTIFDHPKLLAMKKSFEDDPKNPSWKEYWREAFDQEAGSFYYNCPEPLEQLVAWFIQMDIHIFDSIGATKEKPYTEIVSGNLENPEEPCKSKVFIGIKTNIHYQSLLETDNADEKSGKKLASWEREKPGSDALCPGCNFKFTSILKHLSKDKTCKERVDQETIKAFKQKAAERRKAKKKEDQNIRERFESREDRDKRLGKKKAYMKKLRDKSQLKDEEKDAVRKESRENKRKSRQKQREFDHLEKILKDDHLEKILDGV